jgi:hypothetical protein
MNIVNKQEQKMNNPIPKSNLFVTPADMDHLVRLLNESGSKEEQRMAWYGAMMALNLAHNLVEELHITEQV